MPHDNHARAVSAETLDGGEPGPSTTPASTAIANGGHTAAINDAAHAHLRAKAFHGGIASATTSLDLVITSPRVSIDSPGADQYVLGSSTVTVAGWALDLQAPTGSGVDAVHVYGYSGSCGGTSTFLGVARTASHARMSARPSAISLRTRGTP